MARGWLVGWLVEIDSKAHLELLAALLFGIHGVLDGGRMDTKGVCEQHKIVVGRIAEVDPDVRGRAVQQLLARGALQQLLDRRAFRGLLAREIQPQRMLGFTLLYGCNESERLTAGRAWATRASERTSRSASCAFSLCDSRRELTGPTRRLSVKVGAPSWCFVERPTPKCHQPRLGMGVVSEREMRVPRCGMARRLRAGRGCEWNGRIRPRFLNCQ